MGDNENQMPGMFRGRWVVESISLETDCYIEFIKKAIPKITIISIIGIELDRSNLGFRHEYKALLIESKPRENHSPDSIENSFSSFFFSNNKI